MLPVHTAHGKKFMGRPMSQGSKAASMMQEGWQYDGQVGPDDDAF